MAPPTLSGIPMRRHAMAQGDLVQRTLGAATLSIETCAEVEHDRSATIQAAVPVAPFIPIVIFGGFAPTRG